LSGLERSVELRLHAGEDHSIWSVGTVTDAWACQLQFLAEQLDLALDDQGRVVVTAIVSGRAGALAISARRNDLPRVAFEGRLCSCARHGASESASGMDRGPVAGCTGGPGVGAPDYGVFALARLIKRRTAIAKERPWP
jgi:hypothetical protein